MLAKERKKKKKPNPDLGNQEKRLQAVTNRREAWKKQKRISQKINKPSSVFKSWSSCSLVFFEFIRTREIGGMTLSNVQTKRSQSPMPAAVGNIRRRQASAQCPHTNVVSHLGKLGGGGVGTCSCPAESGITHNKQVVNRVRVKAGL